MNCSQHKKEVAGISDMKQLAGMIGDLHYESLAELFLALEKKIKQDSRKDWKGGKIQLSNKLSGAYAGIKLARINFQEAWQISKPFMDKEAVNH